MPFSFKKKHEYLRNLRNSLIVLGILLIVFAVIVGSHTYNIYENELPSFEQLHNIEPSLKTKIYDRNGALLKEFYSENRALTPYKDMPPHLVKMLLASEDREFYSHWGINLRRIFVMAATNLLKWEIAGGASTITQQLSRMLFLNREQTLDRKVREALTSIKLERTYGKDEIIEMYLNQYYFGRGAYGVSAASNIFFGKTVPELTVSDCAILIGLLKGPNINSPFFNPDKSLVARNRVLYSFYEYSGITREEFDSLKNEPLSVSSPEEAVGDAPYFTETVRRYILDKYGEDKLYSGGLKVYTSVDYDLQRAAETALYAQIDSTRARIANTYDIRNRTYTMFNPDTVDANGDSIRVYKLVQGAFLAIDNSNGDVLAMVGGRNFDKSEFNRSVQSLLQPGSAFKPFVYTACIDNGFKTTDIIDDNPIVLDIPGAKQWRPGNFDDKFMGPMTIRDGLRLSRNLIAIRLLLKINPEQAIFYARKMGITTPLKPVASLALGTEGVRLIDMVSAFSVFPNKGIHVEPRMIYKIVDRYGRVLEDNTSVEKEEVLSVQTAYIMSDMLRSVVDNGTGRRARWMGFNRPAGGKTGTSNNFADNWFVGFTPQISAGVWIGFDEKISLGRGQEGSRNAVPVWTNFMIAAHDSLPLADFEEPEGITHSDICAESGEIATDRCIYVRNEVFIQGSQPQSTCHLHPSARLYRPGSGTIIDDFLPDEDTLDAEPTHF